MDKKQSVGLSTLLGKYIIFALVGAAFLFIGQYAQAANSNISVTSATTEVLAANLASAVVQVKCTGGTYTTLGTTNGSGVIGAVATSTIPTASCNAEGDNLSYTIAKDGYVTKEVTTGTYTELAQNDLAISGVKYAYKVTGITAEGTSADLTSSVTGLTLGDVNGKTTCALNTGVWYCPVILANSGTIGSFKADVTLNGYVRPATFYAVTGATARTDNADAQVTPVTIASILYALKITVINVDNSVAIGGATVTAGESYSTTCTENGATGVHYCAMLLADAGTTARAVKTSYSTVIGTYTDRTAASDAQSTLTLSMKDQTSTSGSGGSSGSGAGACVEAWTCNTWSACINGQQIRTCTDAYACNTTQSRPSLSQTCTVVIDETNKAVEKVKVCHVVGNGETNTLEIAPDALAAHLEHGDTAGECVIATPEVVVPHYSPADVITLLSNLNQSRDIDTESKYKKLTVADGKEFKVKMSDETLDQVAIFESYGIDTSTQTLGSGERRAILRDYLQTTGFADIKWEDIIRLTNGERPLGRNLAKEQAQVSKVLATFKVMFGHNPNFQDTTENLAWNTLMYRIRFPRDLNKERAGIGEFRKLFGKTPTTPLQWSAVKVLGYVK